MRRSLFVAAIAGIALVSLPFEARAQMSTLVKPIQFGIAAGASIPMSDLSNLASTGFNGTVTVGLNPASFPLGIRFDGAYNQWATKDASRARYGANIHAWSVTGNVVYKMPAVGISPYLIGGAGFYNTNLGAAGNNSENDFGFNAGAGISMGLSGFDTFLEARYNQVSSTGFSTSFIPITFGIMF